MRQLAHASVGHQSLRRGDYLRRGQWHLLWDPHGLHRDPGSCPGGRANQLSGAGEQNSDDQHREDDADAGVDGKGATSSPIFRVIPDVDCPCFDPRDCRDPRSRHDVVLPDRVLVWMGAHYRTTVAVPHDLVRDTQNDLNWRIAKRLAEDPSFLAKLLASGVCAEVPWALACPAGNMELANAMEMEYARRVPGNCGDTWPQCIPLHYRSTALYATLEGIAISIPAIFYAMFRNRIAHDCLLRWASAVTNPFTFAIPPADVMTNLVAQNTPADLHLPFASTWCLALLLDILSLPIPDAAVGCGASAHRFMMLVHSARDSRGDQSSAAAGGTSSRLQVA